ncbi:MAG: hypothetical protein IKN73_00695 [Alphaproteobacteria bacterium]|nr:hypothetical protein [Alphaproteobacteria bacterium]
MKNTISIFAVLAFAFNVNYTFASECVDEDCELSPVVFETVDILEPQEPEIILWSAESTMSESKTCEYDYNCPFDTAAECEVWYKKPIHNETVAPRAPHLNSLRVDDMLYAININSNYCANDDVFTPLVNRYKMLMRASKACCGDGIVYKMQQNGINSVKIYEFLKDDANHFAITQRCLVTPNDGILYKYSNGVTGEMVADVRNSCLCKNREWFESLLTPFKDIYYRAPQFETDTFNYIYVDSMNRPITASINTDVQNVLEMLEACPK